MRFNLYYGLKMKKGNQGGNLLLNHERKVLLTAICYERIKFMTYESSEYSRDLT